MGDDNAVLLSLPNVKLRRGDPKLGAKSVKGTVSLTVTTVTHTAGRDGAVQMVLLRKVLKQMHSTPGAKHPILSLRLRDESQDDFKFIFQTELEKDQMKDIIAQCLVNPLNTADGVAAAAAEAAAKAKQGEVVAIGDASGAAAAPNVLETQEAAALKENPVLYDLLKETTKEGGAFTQDEFWQGYEMDGKASAAKGAVSSTPIGISSDLLAKFKPQQQRTSQEGTSYRITPDMREQIFQMYPRLKRVYNEKVTQTHEWSAEVFWDTAVKSELFHRGTKQAPLTAAGVTADITELFALCRQKEGVASGSAGVADRVRGDDNPADAAGDAKRRRVANPRYDLDATEDRDVDGYGLTTEPVATKFKQRAKNRIDPTLINQDSEGILHMMTGTSGTTAVAGAAVAAGEPTDTYASLRQAEHLADLEPERPPSVQPLHFSLSSIAARVTANAGAATAVANGAEAAAKPGTRLKFQLNPSALTPTGLTARGAAALARVSERYMEPPSGERVPLELAAEVKKYDVAMSLVLRHYWKCFPPASPDPEYNDPQGKKAVRLMGTLEEDCLRQRLLPLKERLANEHSDELDLVTNLESRLRVAIAHAEKWKVAARLANLAKKAARKRKVREGEG